MAWWIFQNVVMTSAFVAVIALVCRSGRLGPVARHALWVLVLVKFVTPPLIVWPWAAPDPLGIAAIAERPGDRSYAWPAADAPADLAARVEDSEAREPAPVSSTDRPHDDLTIAGLGAVLWPWLLGLWAAGSVCLAGIEGVRLVRLARRRRSAAPADDAIVERVAILAGRLGIQPVPVVMVDGGAAPAVWGAGRPQLLWPADLTADSGDACIDGLLVHELAHVKRGDHLVGWIELAAGVVWWWNPLFWYARAALREQAELACDAWVVSTLPNGRRAYAESLLFLSGATFGGASPSMAAVGIRATSRRVLERRLVMIMQGRAPLRLTSVGLCSLALVAAATLPAWATSQQPPSPPSPPPPPQAPVVAVPQEPPPPPPPAPTPARPPVLRQAAPARPVAAVPQMRIKTTPKALLSARPSSLPADGRELLEAFDTDVEAIREEADKKAEARRETLVKALEALQDQYARAGKLDEAVAIRDYLRAGGPHSALGYFRLVSRVR